MLIALIINEQYQIFRRILPGDPGDRGCSAEDNQLLVEAVLGLARTGSPWRNLPPEFGNEHSTYVRFLRWCDTDV